MHNKRKLALVGVVVVFAFAIGFFVGGERNETQATLLLSGHEDAPEGVDLAPVWKAWRLLEEKHVAAAAEDSLTKQDRIWGIIEGLAGAYDDPYTIFLPPQRSESFEQEISGSFGGVGVEIGMRDDILTVIAPLKGTPAEEAGIFSGDLILEVDGESTQSMTIDDAVAAIRGEVDTEVMLTIARKGEKEFLTIPVIRGTIEIPTMDSELRDDGIFVLSLYNFGGTAMREFRIALREFVANEGDKLIIDLRGNPGGYLEASVDIASWFLPVGKTVVIEEYSDSDKQKIHRSKGYGVMDDSWDIVVLINGGSASASEILAGALQEHDLAVLIGEQTFGKGSVQELVDITPETSLKITVARWLTPNGTSISEAGLTPNLTVKRTRDDMLADSDPQLEAAVTYLMTGELVAPIVEEEESEEEIPAEVEELDEIE